MTEQALGAGGDGLAAMLERPLEAKLAQNAEALKSLYADCADAVIHPFRLGDGRDAVLVYMAGLSDLDIVDRQVMEPLMQAGGPASGQPMSAIELVLPVAKLQTVASVGEVVENVMWGLPCLLIDGEAAGLAFDLADWDKRAIEEPIAESVVRGPREGFTETIGLNMSMLRRKLRTPAFKLRSLSLGRLTRTRVALGYIEGIAPPELVEEALVRLGSIDIDGILESGNVEELIEDRKGSPFPQVLSTERPDVAAAAMMEGRVVILIEGTPFALVAPVSLFSLLQSPEDYYQRFILGTVIRWLRYTFFFAALLFPSLYVAILTYHQEMVPTSLLLSISKSREEIPFPALVEAFLMEFTFEALREAGVRLPKQVGSAVSIVGALVIGQAATAAGLVSPPMVMVVALTGIASFMIPHYTLGISVRLLRFPIMLLAGMLGLLGLLLGVIMVVLHLTQLRSFGYPYLSFFTPGKRSPWKDTLVRAPIWAMRERPQPASESNKNRRPPGKPAREGTG